MKEEENIAKYLLRVDEIVNAIRGLGWVLKEKEVRTLPMKYDSKVSTLEEWDDLEHMILDELHGIFTAYEMRTWQYGISKKDEDIKIQSKDLDDEEALFIRKLERGTRKYQGNLPLKCFNYGRMGHFSKKCSYPK